MQRLRMCLLQEELKLQAIVSKVDNFRENWMGKDNINRQQPFRVNVRYLARILNTKANAYHQNSKRVQFFHNVAFRKAPTKTYSPASEEMFILKE